MKEYAYRTTSQKGKVTLGDTFVECDVKQGFSRWRYQVPYSQLTHMPVRTRKTPEGFWVCLMVGGLGSVASGTRICGFDLSMPFIIAIPMLVASLTMLAYSLRIRRENWITFHSSIPNASVYYCESGPDSENFDSFTDALGARIQTMQNA